MAVQRITITKIGGDSATAVISQFRDWVDARTVDDPAEWGSEQWPPFIRHEADAFASALRSNSNKPPVIYFNEHVDLWSQGNLLLNWFPADNRHQLIRLHSDRFELYCYPLPDNGMLVDLLQRSARLKRIRERNPQEDRWFTINLLEAVLAWNGMVDTAALVLLREVLGGLVEDSELEQSLASIPEWIAKCLANAT